MKKLSIIALIIIATVNVFAELPRTKTIGIDSLSVIRSACQGNDLLIYNYYNEYKGNRDGEEYEEEMFDGRGNGETYKTPTYLKLAFLGVINYDLEYAGVDTVYLQKAYDFLFNPNSSIIDDYFSIANDVIPYLTKPECDSLVHPEIPYESAGRKGLDIGYMLENLAGIVDMLWWYDGHPWTQEQFQDTLSVKLDSLASFAYRRLLYSRPKGMEVDSTNTGDYDLDWDHIEWPAIHDNNFRLRANGALGYAGVVLENSTYIDFVDEELFDYAGGYSSYHILLAVYI